MGTRDPRVDAYIASAPDFAKPILTHLREIVHEACPDVEETMKWSNPHFDYKGVLAGMSAFKAHCAFGFWKGSLIVDPKTAARLHLAACDAGEGEACASLGHMHHRGLGVTLDHALADHYRARACDLGVTDECRKGPDPRPVGLGSR